MNISDCATYMAHAFGVLVKMLFVIDAGCINKSKRPLFDSFLS